MRLAHGDRSEAERGMEDYRLDQREEPERHPAAVD
jgi:hypothetical protein